MSTSSHNPEYLFARAFLDKVDNAMTQFDSSIIKGDLSKLSDADCPLMLGIMHTAASWTEEDGFVLLMGTPAGNIVSTFKQQDNAAMKLYMPDTIQEAVGYKTGDAVDHAMFIKLVGEGTTLPTWMEFV